VIEVDAQSHHVIDGEVSAELKSRTPVLQAGDTTHHDAAMPVKEAVCARTGTPRSLQSGGVPDKAETWEASLSDIFRVLK
jgi:hypothetical protein